MVLSPNRINIPELYKRNKALPLQNACTGRFCPPGQSMLRGCKVPKNYGEAMIATTALPTCQGITNCFGKRWGHKTPSLNILADKESYELTNLAYSNKSTVIKHVALEVPCKYQSDCLLHTLKYLMSVPPLTNFSTFVQPPGPPCLLALPVYLTLESAYILFPFWQQLRNLIRLDRYRRLVDAIALRSFKARKP